MTATVQVTVPADVLNNGTTLTGDGGLGDDDARPLVLTRRRRSHGCLRWECVPDGDPGDETVAREFPVPTTMLTCVRPRRRASWPRSRPPLRWPTPAAATWGRSDPGQGAGFRSRGVFDALARHSCLAQRALRWPGDRRHHPGHLPCHWHWGPPRRRQCPGPRPLPSGRRHSPRQNPRRALPVPRLPCRCPLLRPRSRSAWPTGPTSAANLMCLCRRHHRDETASPALTDPSSCTRCQARQRPSGRPTIEAALRSGFFWAPTRCAGAKRRRGRPGPLPEATRHSATPASPTSPDGRRIRRSDLPSGHPEGEPSAPNPRGTKPPRLR